MRKNRILITGGVLVFSAALWMAGFLSCTRDNPLDPKSPDYIPGTLPEADFPADTSSGFIRDTISITVTWSDTQALGGRTPAVTQLYLYWNGDSSIAATPEIITVSGAGPLTMTRVFTASRNTMVFVRAVDNDTNIGPASGMRLIIDEGKPRITVRPDAAPDSVLTGDTVTVTVTASDTNGTVTGYRWTRLGGDTVTQAGSLKVIFPVSAAGVQTIYVRAIDEDGAVSDRDSAAVTVTLRNDTDGPVVTFISPANNAVVTSQVISVMVQAVDPSGVLFVKVNDIAAGRITGTDVFQRDNVGLDTGVNVIVIQSMDIRYNQSWDTLRVTYRKPDFTPPAIAFSYPAPNDTVTQSPLTVAVTVTDMSGIAWVLCGADTMDNPSGNSYTAGVTLTGEGATSLVITARDNRGNTAVDTLDFIFTILDKTPPLVSIVSPAEAALVTSDSVLVMAQASDTGANASGIASVTVNGLAMTYNALSMSYVRKISLAHGANTIIAVATDASPARNTGSDTVTVVQDMPPHFVPDTSVRDTALLLGGAAAMNLCATDPDGDPLIFSFVTTPLLASAYGLVRSGNCAALSYTPDSAGLDLFRVRVADSVYGLADTILVRITNTVPDLTPPAIAFIAPLPGDTVRESPMTVMVSVTDQSGVAWVRCNGNPMTGSGNNYTLSVTLATEGPQSLVITAGDTRSNSTADTLDFVYIFRDRTPPLVNIFMPADRAVVLSDSVDVYVQARDTGVYRSGIALVTVNGLPATFNGMALAYIARIPLGRGADTIAAAATDSSPAANTSRDTIVVFRNTVPHFVPDVPFKDTGLEVSSAAAIRIRAADADGDTLAFSFMTAPSKDPLAAIAAAGDSATISYTPSSTGADTFSVRLSDGWGGFDTLLIRTFVRPAGDTLPYFTNDTNAIPDTAFTGETYTVQLTAIDPMGFPLRFRLVIPPTPTNVFIDSLSGLLTWMPSSARSDTIVALVNDTAHAGYDTLRWDVDAVERDFPPVLVRPRDTSIFVGDGLEFTLSASDSNGDSLTFAFGASSPFNASLDPDSGIFRWFPSSWQYGVYHVDFVVTEKYRVPALFDTASMVITVNKINYAPYFNGSRHDTVSEGSTLSFVLRATDPNDDPITFSIDGTPPAGARIVNGDNFIWTPGSIQGGAYPVSFIAADNGTPPLCDTLTDTIIVIDTTTPVFGMHTALDTAFANVQYLSAVHAADNDSDRIYYAKLAGPVALAVDDSTGTVSWTPSSADTAAMETVRVTAADHYGNLDTMTWDVYVIVPDYRPHLVDPPDTAITEGKTLQFTLAASDSNNDPLRFSFGGVYPPGATVDSVSGLFSWTPTYRQAAGYMVIFRVTERNRTPPLSDSVTVMITVKDTNMAPVFITPSRDTACGTYEDVKVAFTLRASDVNGDTLTYYMVNPPQGAMILNKTGFTWTPSHLQGGAVYPFSFVVHDSAMGVPKMTDTVGITITVLDTTKPVFVKIASDTAYVNSPFSLTVAATDADSDAVTYTKVQGPDSLKVDKYGIITWTPGIKDTTLSRPDTVAIQARDNNGNFDTLRFSLWVFPRWPRIYRVPATGDTGLSVIQTGDGCFAVCGTVGDSAIFMKADSSGNPLLFRTYGISGRRWSARCIREASSIQGGGFIMCGKDSSLTSGATRLLLIRINSAGDTLWTGRYQSSNASFPYAEGASVCVTGEGFVACGSAMQSLRFQSEMWAMMVDQSGKSQWERLYYPGTFSGGGSSRGRCIRQTSEGGFILTGDVRGVSGISGGAIFLVKTTPTGDTASPGWMKTIQFVRGVNANNYAYSVQEAADASGYFICGNVSDYSPTPQIDYGIVFKTNTHGDTVKGWKWTIQYADATGIRATPDGGCIASFGKVLFGTYSQQDATLVKMTSAVTLEWTADYGTANPDRANDVSTVSWDGGYIFTGFTLGSGTSQNDIYLVRTTRTGAIVQ